MEIVIIPILLMMFYWGFILSSGLVLILIAGGLIGTAFLLRFAGNGLQRLRSRIKSN